MFDSSTRPIRTLALSALTVAALLSGCAAPQPSSDAPETLARSASRATVVPSWVGDPLSWNKLGVIEEWLADPSAPGAASWGTEAWLVLSEGRLQFARNDGAAAATADVSARLSSARRGFERVLAESDASSGQRARAERGIAQLDQLEGSGVADASATSTRGLVRRAGWNARPGNPARMRPSRSSWDKITLHHSAMNSPLPLRGSLADSSAAVRDIQRAQMDGKDFGDIGYHFLIDPFGRVFEGRELTWQGAHAGGVNNVRNIGVCLIGNFERERPTRAALESLEYLLEDLRTKYGISSSNVRGHHEWKSTSCPGKNLIAWIDRYR